MKLMKLFRTARISSQEATRDEDQQQQDDARMFGRIHNFDSLLSYISSYYPCFTRIVLPITISLGVVVYINVMLSTVAEMFTRTEKQKKAPIFYRKCDGVDDNTIFDFSDAAEETIVDIPARELTVLVNIFIVLIFAKTGHRKINITVLVLKTLILFFAPLNKFTKSGFLLFQALYNIFLWSSMILCCESVPKLHRLCSIAIMELGMGAGGILAVTIIRFSYDLDIAGPKIMYTLTMSFVFTLYLVFFFYQDSIFSLQALSRYDELQESLVRINKISEMNLPVETIVDQVAFEKFESSSSTFDILFRIFSSFAIVRETIVCGLIAGCILAIEHFCRKFFDASLDIRILDLSIVTPFVESLGGVVVLVFSLILPDQRVMTIVISIVVMSILSLVLVLTPQAREYDICANQEVIKEESQTVSFACMATIWVLGRVLLVYMRLHLIEFLPVLSRLPVFTFLYAIRASFVVQLGPLIGESQNPSLMLMFVTTLAMLFFLLTPRKSTDMNVYFSDLLRKHRHRHRHVAPESAEVDEGL